MAKKIAAILTCFNRREKTETCLDSLFRAERTSCYEEKIIERSSGGIHGRDYDDGMRHQEVRHTGGHTGRHGDCDRRR